MLVLRIIGSIVYIILFFIMIKRFKINKKTCMVDNYIFVLGVMCYFYAIALFIGYSDDDALYFSTYNLAIGTILYILCTILAYILLSLSCNYKVIIESDKVVYYNFFVFKKTIFYDSIIAKESYYTFKRPKIVLITNEKKYIIRWYCTLGMGELFYLLKDLKIKIKNDK